MEYVFIDILSSSVRWGLGIGMAAFVGYAVAIPISMSVVVFRVTGAAFDFLRAIPILALVPLILYYLGPAEPSKILVVFIACVFPILVSTVSRLCENDIDADLFFEGLGLSRYCRWRLEYLPRIIEGLRTGALIAIGTGWISVVAAELLGVYSDSLLSGGLGYRIWLMYQTHDLVGMWTYTIIFGVLGFASSRAYRAIFRGTAAQ